MKILIHRFFCPVCKYCKDYEDEKDVPDECPSCNKDNSYTFSLTGFRH